jgi:phthalate 4,5-dioxygenase oxygenase subunit
MKLGNFTGIAGIPNQDIAMWETMGRNGIVDRTKERLGASDIAVVEFRRLMIDAARRMRDTGVAIGRTTPHIPHAKISSFEGIVPKTTDWRTLGVAPEELALRDDQERVA